VRAASSVIAAHHAPPRGRVTGATRRPGSDE
jgi:hypothetical protein